jgi:hypothetical protein
MKPKSFSTSGHNFHDALCGRVEGQGGRDKVLPVLVSHQLSALPWNRMSSASWGNIVEAEAE